MNKKVLLRERKRHTPRRISSIPSAVLSWGVHHPWLGGTPSWGTPHSDLAGGSSSWGIPHAGLGYPWEGIWDQSLGYPRKGMGWVEVLSDGDGVPPPPRKDMGPMEVLWDEDGVPLTVWTYKQTETITFPHPMDVGGNNQHIYLKNNIELLYFILGELNYVGIFPVYQRMALIFTREGTTTKFLSLTSTALVNY